ncbi:HNH endonuclease [compost metagenome]
MPAAVSNRYNHSDVKGALKVEAKHKCMYCESKVSHVSYEHIEHIKPKAKDKYPELTFEWGNLGLACPVCNMNKSDEYDPNLPFLNPYVDNPNDYLFASGPYVFGKPGQGRGKLTEKYIKLNRVELVEQRLERIDAIRQLMDSYENEQNPMLKKIIYKELLVELGEDKPYALVLNSMVKIVGVEAA